LSGTHPFFQGKLYAFEYLKSWRAMGEPTFTFIRGVSKFLPVLDGFLPLKFWNLFRISTRFPTPLDCFALSKPISFPPLP
jgi:hypothetical protein